MTAQQVINRITTLGPVIPVLQFDDVAQGEAVCRALYAGGIRVFEITLRTAAGLPVLERASQIADDIVVGVGTLTRADQCTAAVKAGAQFGVSPGLTANLNQAAKDAGLPLLPGIMTPTDIMLALEAGYETVKFFPAQPVGGTALLHAFGGPFPSLKFCPTGGITYENAIHYLKLPNVVCVGGSWLAPKGLIQSQSWEAITRLAREASCLGGT
jgi:2-dehydro-3-deoxyphosphogluconate aldolase/(4S)-4-hydroxy-2-oxoglutarate aldolase